MPQHKKLIVAVNSDGTMAGYFESMYDLCRIYHLTNHHVAVSCNTGKLYRGMRWMWDADYKRLWLEGRTHELRYTRPDGQKPMQRGDKIGGIVGDHTAYMYVCGLLRRFGPDVTLEQIKEQLKAEEKNDPIEEDNKGTTAAWT